MRAEQNADADTTSENCHQGQVSSRSRSCGQLSCRDHEQLVSTQLRAMHLYQVAEQPHRFRRHAYVDL